jgi:SAM-dependent methyltransferase
MDQWPSVDREIADYYSGVWNEDARLRSGLAQIELVRTQEIIRRHLPDHPLRIVDVGGGSGVHAEWLLDDGYSVHLVEPVVGLVEIAVERLGDEPGFSCEVGEARGLACDDSAFDVVLLLGPLYHLIEESQRVAALQEALRVVKPGGVLFASAITRFASLVNGLASGMIFDADYEAMVRRTLADGQHRSPPGREFFTKAFYHRPDELQAEVESAGWKASQVFGIEGLTMAMPHLADSWTDPERRSLIVDMARMIETEPSLIGLGPHILAVARR